MNTPLLVLIAVLTVAVVTGGVYLGYGFINNRGKDSASMQEVRRIGGEDEEAETSARSAPADTNAFLDVSDVVKKAMPSVVSITNQSVQEVTSMFRGSWEVESVSSGSGIIIGETSDELLVATNYHVVEDAASLTVCFSAEVEKEEDAAVPAEMKGGDEVYDLAVVAVSLTDISDDVKDQIYAAEMGSSADLVVGEPAIAIGNALGYGQSVTRGIISALDRSIEIEGESHTYIQTDAAINFGNSGGALLNENGEVIGINSAKATSFGVEGMGYAIPIDDAAPVLSELMNRETRQKLEKEEQGYLGIYVQDISSETRSLYDIPNGVYVAYVAEGSPAEEAGISEGDIINSMDGLSIASASRFEEMETYYRPGETVSMEILSANRSSYKAKTIEITFSEQPEQESFDGNEFYFRNGRPF